MRLHPGIVIEALGESECDEFFQYLNDHRSDNGQGATGYGNAIPCIPFGIPQHFAE
jgi:hypothetical protein